MPDPTKRAWLHSQGLTSAPTGRGRFSREAEEAYQKALRDGVKFAEPAVRAPATPRAPRPETEGIKGVVRRGRKADSAPEIDQPKVVTDNSGATFPNPEFKDTRANWEIPTPDPKHHASVFKSPLGIVKASHDGGPVREVCARCRFSIGWCTCATPWALYAHKELGQIMVPLTAAG